ncbi:MAG: metallophosphoesterase [archaeon]|nr:metallophosphoesterase [Nanoarchaeota archaeon]
MKYAHIADLHLGSWRDQRMRDLSTKAFLSAVNDCVARRVDFILFAGDLFNTSLPSIDTLKIITSKLKELNEKGISLYTIAGSHDFSPSGKTMLDVLENAGLLINVCKGTVNPETKQLELNFTVDSGTGAKITGIIGRRGLLDKTYYENLNRESFEKEGRTASGKQAYKIFMFHTTLTELKPKHLEMMDSQPASFLPKGFNYYAGGHVHHPTKIDIPELGVMTYPGALFPNNFAELEKYSKGGYYLISVSDSAGENSGGGSGQGQSIAQDIEWIPIEVIKHQSLVLDCKQKTPEQVKSEIIAHFSNEELSDLNNTLVTIRLFGQLSEGKTSDINFQEIFDQLYQQGAYFVMKNANKLTSKEFEEIKTGVGDLSNEEVEENIIKEHLQQFNTFEAGTELQLIKSLINVLNTKKGDGEKVYDFDDRIMNEIDTVLDQNDKS